MCNFGREKLVTSFYGLKENVIEFNHDIIKDTFLKHKRSVLFHGKKYYETGCLQINVRGIFIAQLFLFPFKRLYRYDTI